MKTTEAYRARKKAIQEAKESEAHLGQRRSYCRLYARKDSGTLSERCWLLPGHESECVTREEALR